MKNKGNKIVSCLFVLFNAIGMIATKDGTMFAFSLMIGIPLFFSKHNWIN